LLEKLSITNINNFYIGVSKVGAVDESETLLNDKLVSEFSPLNKKKPKVFFHEYFRLKGIIGQG